MNAESILEKRIITAALDIIGVCESIEKVYLEMKAPVYEVDFATGLTKNAAKKAKVHAHAIISAFKLVERLNVVNEGNVSFDMEELWLRR